MIADSTIRANAEARVDEWRDGVAFAEWPLSQLELARREFQWSLGRAVRTAARANGPAARALAREMVLFNRIRVVAVEARLEELREIQTRAS